MKRFKVIYKNLKKVWGYADLDKVEIHIDQKAKGKKHLEIVIHEAAHLCWPDESEESIVRKSIMITNTLWHENYRRVDDRNDLPLQDGTK
jgi:hypothetical protein